MLILTFYDLFLSKCPDYISIDLVNGVQICSRMEDFSYFIIILTVLISMKFFLNTTQCQSGFSCWAGARAEAILRCKFRVPKKVRPQPRMAIFS